MSCYVLRWKMKLTIVVFLLLIYFIILGIYNYSMDTFAYMGFLNNFSMTRFYIATISVFIFAILIKTNGLLAKYHLIMITLVVIPSSIIYIFIGGDYYIFLTYLATSIVLCVSIIFKMPLLKSFSVDDRDLFRLFWTMIVVYFALIFTFGGGIYLNFNLLEVYNIRDEASNNLPSIFTYFSPIIGKIVIPLVIVLALERKKYIFAFLGIVAGVFVFALTAHKSPLFYGAAVFFLYFLYNRKFSTYFLLSVIVILFTSFIDIYFKYTVSSDSFGVWHSILFRRSFLVPSLLNNYFIDFFSQNEFYYWSQSRISLGWVQSYYDVTAPFLIGREYFGDMNMAANTGWIGSGYSNSGLIGVVLYSLILGMMLAFFNSISYKIGERLVFCSSIITVLVLFTSTDLLTIFVTHGAIFLIIILTIIKADRNILLVKPPTGTD